MEILMLILLIIVGLSVVYYDSKMDRNSTSDKNNKDKLNSNPVSQKSIYDKQESEEKLYFSNSKNINNFDINNNDNEEDDTSFHI